MSLHESLQAAQLAIRDEKRRPAITQAIQRVVRADQRDPLMAEIAVQTLDLGRLAAELAARADYRAWADRLAPAITAPPPPTADSHDDSRNSAVTTADPGSDDTDRGRAPTRRRRSTAERVANILARTPDARPAEVAARLGVSERTVQRNWPTPNGTART